MLHNSLTLKLESVRQVEDPGDRGGAHVYLTGVGVRDGLGVVTFRVQRELLLQVDEVICVLGREGGDYWHWQMSVEKGTWVHSDSFILHMA